MTTRTESAVRLLAGTLVLASLAVGYAVDPRAYLVTAFVGANLAQSAITGLCPAELVLDRLLGADGGPAAGRGND
jgi:hypothetical protein